MNELATSNPVLSGFYPDPSVCRVDGEDGTWYYLVNSTFEYLPGIPVHRSRDLINWELIGHVIHRPEQVDMRAVRDSGGMFAPTIRHDGQRFLVVCTQVEGDPARKGNFVCTATDPAGPWSDPIWWTEGDIDPSILVDDDGSLWAHGTYLIKDDPEWEQQTQVWVKALDPETLKPRGEEHKAWTGAVRGAIWTEGPHLYRRGEHVYLLASEGGTFRHHALTIARADHPTGPYVGNPGNPILTHRHLGRDYPVMAVGHADLVDDPEGNTWSLALAVRPRSGTDHLGRETFLVDVVWEDGWPVYAPGRGVLPERPTHPAPVGEHHLLDQPVDQRIAVRRQLDEMGVVDRHDGAFEVPAGPGLDDKLPAFVALRLLDHDARLEVHLVEAADGVEAGIGLRYSGTAWASATLKDGVVRVRCVARDRDPVEREVAVEGTSGVFSVEFRAPNAVLTWEPDGAHAVSLGQLDLSGLCTMADGGFVGLTFGALALGEDGSAVFTGLAHSALMG